MPPTSAALPFSTVAARCAVLFAHAVLCRQTHIVYRSFYCSWILRLSAGQKQPVYHDPSCVYNTASGRV